MALGNLASRILVAVVAVPILLVAIYHSRPEIIWAVVFGATLLALYELFSMTLTDRVDRVASLACGAAASLSLYWLRPPQLGDAAWGIDLVGGPMVAMFLAVIPISLYYLFRFGELVSVGARFAQSLSGIVYVGVLFTFVALLKRDFATSSGHLGGDLIVFVLMVSWVGDTGAYFAGRFLGRRKLYPAVSPKKTWAGALGGVAASALAGAAVKLVLIGDSPLFTWFDCFAIAVPGAILGQLGDLVESLIKRSTGVKDSGNILPGHGGILDRIDAVIFLAPYVYLYMVIRPQV